ncbi:MAG: hypothetical protein K6E36_08455 [Oscillospiraceae bacterium]|nr:DUF4299 family protein [Oscillospiraceae bacterium]MCR5306513.1 hypothetical protein [Oscillospiraceae bacterium]
MADRNVNQGNGLYDWSKAYVAVPRYYRDPDGKVFGAMAINEGIETILPLAPHERYRDGDRMIPRWRLVLYSKTQQKIIGDVDFYDAMKCLSNGYFLDGNDEKVLVRALSLTELDALLRRCGIADAR